MDLETVLRFAIAGWWQDKPTLKYFSIMIGLYVALIVVSISAIAFFSLSAVNVPQAQQILNLLAVLPSLILIVVVLVIVFMIAGVWLSSLMMIRALQLSKFKTAPLDFYKVLRVIVFVFVRAVYILLSIFDIKWLSLGIAAVALFVLAIFSIAISPLILLAVFPLGIILAMAYFVIIIINSIRLIPAVAFYLHYDESMFLSLERAWKLTEGYTVILFAYSLIMGFIAMMISMVFQSLGYALGVPFTFLGNPLAMTLVAGVIGVVGSTILQVMFNFFHVKIYVELLSEKKKTAYKIKSKTKA